MMALARHDHLLDVRIGACRTAVVFFIEHCPQFMPAVVLELRVAGMTDDGEQPGAALPAVKAAKELAGALLAGGERSQIIAP
jgi:hypothetical protein